jgi:hypothetical protein
MRTALSIALVLAAGSVSRPGCGKSPPEPTGPCILAPRPCGGNACGEACTTGGGGCPEAPAGPGVCDAYEVCIPASSVPVACGPSSACAGKTCGTECDRCGGACATPIAGACDYAGWCLAADLPWLCYDPCAGKACGERCTECPPSPPTCIESGVAKACDAGGHCVAASSALACPP